MLEELIMYCRRTLIKNIIVLCFDNIVPFKQLFTNHVERSNEISRNLIVKIFQGRSQAVLRLCATNAHANVISNFIFYLVFLRFDTVQ